MISQHPRTADLELVNVLAALGNPLRLQIVRVLADTGERNCGSIVEGVPPSTMTRHWKVLRDAGVIWQKPVGRENLLSLRTDDLAQRFPGLLDSVLGRGATDSSH